MKRKQWNLFGKGVFLSFLIHALAYAVPYDRDRDGVADWEDFCPNTPLGATVWTNEKLKTGAYSLRWVGCVGGETELPEPNYYPPAEEEVIAENSPTVVNGLSQLTKNLVQSYEQMAKASIKPKAIVFSKAQERLARLNVSPSVSGVLEELCGNRLLLGLTLPVIEGTSSKVFNKPIEKARQLHQLLSDAVGNSCETLHLEKSAWALSTKLSLLQSGWNALSNLGFKEGDLKLVSEIKMGLGVALASIESKDFNQSLTVFLNLQEKGRSIVESFHENENIMGISVMMASVTERLKAFLISGHGITLVNPLELGVGVSMNLSPALVSAALLTSMPDDEEIACSKCYKSAIGTFEYQMKLMPNGLEPLDAPIGISFETTFHCRAHRKSNPRCLKIGR